MTISPLALDFKSRRRPSTLGLSLLAIGLCACVFAGWTYRHAGIELDDRLRELDQLRRVARPRHVAPLPTTDPDHMRRVLDRLNLPWETLFEAIERTPIEQATLLSMMPDADKGSVQVRGEARDIGVALYYISRLQEGGFFRGVELVEHEYGGPNPDLPMRFLIMARWPAARNARDEGPAKERR